MDKFSVEDSLVDYYLMVCRAGDPREAVSKWSVGAGPRIEMTRNCVSSDEDDESRLSKMQDSLFDSHTE